MEVSGDLVKINKKIAFLTFALSQTTDDHPNMPLLLASLGNAHDKRFDLLNELEDLEKAIEYKTITLTLSPDNDPGLSELLFTLAIVHGQRFQHLGDLDDIVKGIEYGNISVNITPDDDSAMASRLVNLGVFHGIRFQNLGERADLEDSILYMSRALALTPDGDSNLLRTLHNLGGSHIARFDQLGMLSDIEKAINYATRALMLAPDGHPDLPVVLAHLGKAHTSRFTQLNELKDLEAAMEYRTRALALTPEGHPDLPTRLANIGGSHSNRFERIGELDDLELAIEYETRALTLTPEGHLDLSSRLADLGVSHIYRFARLGELGDLACAIEYQTRAVDLLPDRHPRLPNILANLGGSHVARYERLAELGDLERAIEYQNRAITLTPDRDPDLPSALSNLGVSHHHRFVRLGELGDLKLAIEYETRALALIPDRHPDLTSILTSLGASHRRQFKHLGELADLELASKYQSRALELTPHDHPKASTLQSYHASIYLDYYQQTGDQYHLQHSLRLLRAASQSRSCAPRDKFGFAHTWAQTAFKHSPSICIEAYQTAIDLLPQFIWLGATTEQRYQDLLMTETLALEAANAAIRSSNHSLALEWLEHARCVVWNQSLMLRSPLDKLYSIDSDLGAQLQSVANQLRNAGSYSRESQALASGCMTPEQVGQKHRRLAKEYDDLLARIRQLPGLDDFLRPMKAKHLLQAARTGPVVVINCYEDSCDALLILPGQPTIGHVPLPSFSAHKAQQARQTLEGSLRRKGIRERGVTLFLGLAHQDGMSSMLATLWHDVVKPILDYLGYVSNDSATMATLPHITWCPTGALSFLPLHAAGDYDQPLSRVFDYVISSYTPTLTALLASIPDSLSTSCRVLAIGQANTPGHSALPGTTRELACVQAHTKGHAQYSQLTDGQATVSAVLNAMNEHDWVHLACHAHQNVSDPTKSGFSLHDGTLDLAEINRRSFKGKGLAFLSACQTATGDERLADEAVHLASGMLMAGYSSVIATMWSVHDEDAPRVADKVYAQLMQDRTVGNGQAGVALHYAVAALRERVGEEKFEQWVPYIHIGS